MRRRRLFFFLPLVLFLAACSSGPQTKPFSFIVLDDIHFARAMDYTSIAQPDERTVRTISQSEATFLPLMNELKEQAQSFLPKAAAIISCGDIVHGGVEDPAGQYGRFFSEYKSVGMPIPLFNANGNHEMAGAGMERAYDSTFLPFMSGEAGKQISARHFSLDLGNSHFVLLDALPPGRRGGDHEKRIFELTDPERRWLEADLEANENREHIFVFAHPPIWPVNSGDVWYVYDPKSEGEFVDLLLKYNVRLYFAGHEHVNSVVVYENPEGKQLVQMIPDSEIRLAEPSGEELVMEYAVATVAGGDSPWHADLEALVSSYADRIRYFRKRPQLAGYFMVTVEGPEVTVRMFQAPGKKPAWEYKVSSEASTGRTRFDYSQP